MYCSGCGTELEAGLNFCKRCGKRVKEERTAIAQNLSNAVGAIGVFGVLGFALVLYLMLRSPIISPGTIMMVSFLYLATLFGISFLILKQTAQFTLKRPPVDDRPVTPAYLRPVMTSQLGESTQEPISVTEHTTKDLDETPVARK